MTHGRHAAPNRVNRLVGRAIRPGLGRSIAQTAVINTTVTIAGGLGGVITARVFGPSLTGEYTAITAWFGFALILGGMGLPAALCFYVARDPGRAKSYVATARAMMLVTGMLAISVGAFLAPVLARGHPAELVGYRIAFGTSILAFLAASYTFSLQARDIRKWNIVRVSQPVLSLMAIGILWRLHLLTLVIALVVLAATMLMQLAWAYWSCRTDGLAPGRADARLLRPLAGYGLAQIAALTPAVVNTQLDQLVLSQTVPPADLGRYAIAVSLSLLPLPLVSAIGSVGFPWLAAQRTVTDAARRLQRIAILASFGITIGTLVPFALIAHWLVPLLFGPGYRGAVPLLWILTPGTVFLSCGQVVGDLLRGRNRPIIVAWAQGSAAVFTVCLLIVLVPLVGVYGAAIASTIAYGIALVVMLRSLWRIPEHNEPANKETLRGQLIPEGDGINVSTM